VNVHRKFQLERGTVDDERDENGDPVKKIRDETDEALRRRHEERERVSEEQRRKAALIASEAPLDHLRFQSVEIVISAWRFPTSGWKVQLTPVGDAIKESNAQFITLSSLASAASLWRQLGIFLRERSVIL
jgi:hypothetical protein